MKNNGSTLLTNFQRIQIVREMVAQLRSAGFQADQKLGYFVDLPAWEVFVSELGPRNVADLPADIRAVCERADRTVRARWAERDASALRAAAHRAELALDDMRGA